MYQATYDNGSLSLKINEVEVSLSNVIDTVKLTYDSGTSELACGSLIIPTLEFTLLNTVACVLMDTVELNVGNIPFHKFIVVSADKQEYITKFKAYVEPYERLSKGFFGDLEDGYTVHSMLNEIATKTGVVIDGVGSLPNLPLTRGDVTATGDDGTEQTQKGTNYVGKTYLEQLSLISGFLGKNIIFTRNNHIKFTNLNTTDIVLTDLEKPTRKTNSYSINKIICSTGRDTELVAGSATLSETLSLSNCYMTQEQLNALLTQFQGIQYEAFEFNHAQANLLIEPYDMVSFEYKGQNYVIPVQYLQIVFSAKGANYIVKSFVKQGESAVSEYKGTLTSRVDNVYTEVMQVRQLIANIGQFEEIEAVVAKIDNLYAKVGHIQNLLAGTITSEEINTIHLTSQNAVIDNAVVKSEMIESLAVSKLASGVIDTSKIQIQATNGHMTIADNTIRFIDSNGNTRLYMGEDTNGNFSYQVYNANGTGLLLDENGLKEIAITDGLIKTNMINNQAITGDKINWTSFCESFNSSTNTSTLDSAHITMDGKRLDSAFNQLSTTVNGQTETINTHSSQLTQQANSIQGLVSATTITKEDGTTVGVKDEIANMKLTQDSFQVSISNMENKITSASFNNLLWNSDFAILDDRGFPRGYSMTGDGTTVMLGGWLCPEGGKTILVDTLGKDINWQGFRSPYIKVNKDQQFTASVYVATENYEAIDANLGLEIEWYGADGSRINTQGYLLRPTENHKWYRISATGVAPEGTVKACVYCWNEYHGATWWGKPMLQVGSIMTAWDRGGDFDNINERLSNAELKITDDAIIASVSGVYETKAEVTHKINNIQVGGTNLWVISDTTAGFENNGGIADASDEHRTRKTIIPTNGARQLVYQCWNPNGIVNTENSNRIAYFDTNRNYITWDGVPQLSGNPYQYQLMDIPTNAVYMRLGAICGVNGGSYDPSIKIKFEFGNKATDWTPAPEDVQSSIDTKANASDVYTKSQTYTREETNSQINIAKNEINLGVSSTYETKTEATNKMNNAIYEARHIPDTRDTNETPHWYMSNYPKQTITEFKHAGTIGLPENGISYYTMTTTVPWDDNSGGRPTQVARNSVLEQTYERVGISDTEWSAWLKIENASSVERRVNSAKEEMRSEINVAKDAVTTTVSNLKTEVMSASYNNLLWNSDFLTWENDFPKGYYSTNRTYCFGGGWICPDGGKTIAINTSAGGVDWQGWQSSTVKVRQDQTLTASVYVAIESEEYRGTVNFGIEILWLREDGSRITQSGTAFTIDTIAEWKRVSVTGTAPEGTAKAQIYCWNQTRGVSWWGKPMLQFGSVMTAWTRGGDFEKVEERLSYAEQKITDDAITNTVRQNFYTKQETENSITSKGYATSSQVQQTADSLTATFTKSGGCNLFRNSGFKCLGDAFRYWYVWNHEGRVNSGNFEINRANDDWGFPSWITDSMVIHVVNPTGDTYVEYGRGQTVDTTAGQTYTVSCYYAMHRVTSANIVVRDGNGHWIATQGLDTSKTGGNGSVANWGRATLTFTATGTRHAIEFMLHGVTDAADGYMWIVQPMCNEGDVAQPYSVHPNEAYDGVIMMDYEGIKVSATGFGGYTHMTKDGFYLNNGSTDVFYVNGDGLKIGSNPSTSINGDVIRSGNIVANNGDLTFNLNSGQMYYKYSYNQVGFLGVTDGNSFSLSTDAKGWCMNSDYGSFSSMGAKSASGGNYVPYLTVTSGGVSNYNAGIFLSMPLNYGSATGTNMTVKNVLEMSSKVSGAGLFNPKIAWRNKDVATGEDLFTRSNGDRIDIYTTGSTTKSDIYLRLADDVNTYFNITCNHYVYGHQSIASFRYVTDINGYGIDFYRGLNMHNYNLGNVTLKNAKSVQTASLALLDDEATVQTASPAAMYALDNGIEATQATITQHIATSINKTVTFNGTELVEGTSEYIELPQDFLMCVDIQVTLTPNKLCRFAVTSKDEFGFVIETDTEGVTFDYVVIGTKMDGTLFASLHDVEPDIKPVIDDEEEYVPYTTDNLMLPQELIDKGYTTFADATEEEMEAMKFEQVFGSPVEEEEVVEEEEEVTEEEVTEETQEDIIIENEDDLNGIDTGTIIENY